jgi:predicted Na+-dependent transporter
MQQTKLESLCEAIISTVIGFIVTLAASPIIYPMFGHKFTTAQNLGITAVFTLISVARGYAIRRWADKYMRRLSRWLALLIVKKVDHI